MALVGYSKGIINRLPFFGDIAEATQASIIVIPLLLSLPALVNKFCLADYLFYFICVFYYLSCYVFFPDNAPLLTENAFMSLCCAIPFYFIGRLIDIDRLFNILLVLSAVTILMDLFYHLVYTPGQKDMTAVDNYDNMFRAYRSLPHVAMLFWATFRKFRIWKAALSIIGVLFLISCGTRGTLVCLGFFCLVYFFFFMKFKGTVYVKGAIVALFLFIAVYIREIALFLARTFLNLNLSTRIIEKFISGDIGNDSQRSSLREILYHGLDSGNYFWGMGAFGNIVHYNCYAHFLPLDFFCTFGYLVGSVLLAVFVAFICLTFWKTSDNLTREFVFFTFSIGIIKLLMSSTFLLEPYFFLFIGVCARVLMVRQTSNAEQGGLLNCKMS